MLVLLLLSIEIIAGFYWLKSSLDEEIGRVITRLDSIEGDLNVIKQRMTEPGKRE